MSLLSDIASDHQLRRTRLAQRTANRVRSVWGQADVSALDAWWDILAPEVTGVVVAAQVAAARQAAPYLGSVSQVYGGAPAASLVPEAFGGVMLDGREVGPALFGAVTTTKKAIGAGMSPAAAMQAGMTFLGLLAKSAVTDMGRQADNTLATGRGFTHYVRLVNPGACSRCAILAGSDRYSKPFKRHPACKCTSVPIKDVADIPKGMFSSPEEYFESLSRAYAIRNGADPISVVNARRGALTGGGLNGSPSRLVKTTIGRRADGSPLQVFLTGEGTTVRSAFGRQEVALTESYTKSGRYRRTTTARLMPEQIQIMAGDNAERAAELFRKYGYLR
jgi:hypothetical protein